MTVLYDDAVIAANPDSEMLKQIQTQLQTGALPSPDLLGRGLTVVPLSLITSVSANQRKKDVTLRYTKNKKATLDNIGFASGDDRNEFFKALHAKLEPQFEYSLKEFNVFQAMITPIVVLLVLIYATYLCYGAGVELSNGVEPEIRGRHQLLKLLFVGWSPLLALKERLF